VAPPGDEVDQRKRSTWQGRQDNNVYQQIYDRFTLKAFPLETQWSNINSTDLGELFFFLVSPVYFPQN
jgi:hypothetical protein